MSQRMAKLLFMISLNLLLVACGGTSAPTRNTPKPPPSKTLYMVTSAGIQALQANDGTPLWTFARNDGFGMNVSITAAASSVYWATQDTIYAFDSHTGKQLWSQPGQQTSDMAVGDNLLYIASSDLLYALDRQTGTLEWRQDLTTSSALKIGASLILAQKTLYVATQDTVFALDATTGTIRWKDVSNTQTSYPVKNIIVEKNIIVIIRDGFVKGVAASDDHQLWTIDKTTPIPSFMGSDTVSHDLYTCNSFATSTVLYLCLTSTPGISSNQQASFAAYDLPTGKLLWDVQDAAAEAPSFSFQNPFAPTAMTKDGIFALTGPDNGDLEARSLQDGHILWTKLGTGSYQGLTVKDDRLYTQTNNGEIDAFTLKDGTRSWTLTSITGTYWLDQTLYMEANNALLAVDPQTGRDHWQKPLQNGIENMVLQ